MPDDPNAIVDTLDAAEDAFGEYAHGRPEYEETLDPGTDDSDVIQLRKACRLLDACRLLRAHDGYHTSVIEMSFATIERTLEFYALTASNDSVEEFQNHERAYDRAEALGLISGEVARRLKQLYRDNRSAAYYRDTVATAREADAMFELAVAVHDHVKHFAQLAHECRCDSE